MELKEAGTKVQETVGEKGLAVSRTIHRAVLGSGEAGRTVADILHGKWLGHPLHPALTDITIGSWALAGLFDAVGEIQDDRFARKVGDRLTAVGCAAAIPTALTGLADYSTLPKEAAGTATWHGALNGAILGLYVLSLRERKRGNRGRGLFCSGLALGMACVSAWLGGRLVYKHRVGVDHADRFAGPRRWTAVLPSIELAHGEARRVEVEGKGVLLHRSGDHVHAVGAVCAHAGGPLEHGKFEEGTVQCPWHDSVYRLDTGEVKHGPSTRPIACFETREMNGQIEIRLMRS